MNDAAAAKAGLPLYYWNYLPNFGDQISRPIVEWVTGREVRRVEAKDSPKLVAVGSVLDVATDRDVVWGSGVHPTHYRTPSTRRLARLFAKKPARPRVLAVRGPITRDYLLSLDVECPPVFGDPAIVLPRFFTPHQAERREVALVAHYRDREEMTASGLPLIDVGQDWRQVVSEIAACGRVITTSLHGIIVAEAYGVQAVWLRTLSGEGFVKFADYYLSTGRVPQPVYSLEEAIRAEPPPLPAMDSEPLIRALREADLTSLGS